MLAAYQTPFEITGRLGPIQQNLDIPDLDIRGHVGKVELTAQGKIINGQLTLDFRVPKASTDDVPIKLHFENPIGVSQLHAHLVALLFPNESQSHTAEVTINPLRANLHLGQSTIHLSGKGTPSHFSLVGDSTALFSKDFPISLPVQQPFSF